MPRKMSLKHSLILFFTLFMLASCDKNRAFDQYKQVGEKWHKDSIVTFTFNQNEVSKNYNLFVNIRDNSDYKFSNLYLIVSMEHPNGFTKVDTLQYLMANPDGTLLGDGFTDVKDNKLVYKENFKFPKSGKYIVKIQQAQRKTGNVAGEKSLDGITDVGFRIEKILKN
jgi:gliding motility-associated lipoprotein GldH